ncbi:MAG TPA: hypothetical protein VIK11_13925, partial [Tepidiformaceae bacterium]
MPPSRGTLPAGRGFPLTSASAPMQPSNDLTAQHPAFSVAPTEHGDAALKRLLQVTPDYVRATTGGLELVGLKRYRNTVMQFHPRGYWRLGEIAASATAVDEAGTQDGSYNG